MTDIYKGKQELIAELEAARQRVAELESEKERRHRAETVLRKNAEFLRGILDTSAAGIFVADHEATIVFANPRIEELFGMPIEQFIGRSCLVEHWELHDASGQRLTPENDPYRRGRDHGERTFDLTAMYQRPDGTVRHLMANVAPLRAADGTVSHVVFAMNDVTERVQAEEAYRVLLEDSLQGFCLVQDDKVVYANPALARMFGCGMDELLGLNAADGMETFVHPADHGKFAESFDGLALGRLPRQRFEWRLQRRDGGTRYVETYLSIVLYEGRPAIQFIDLDITERREAEQALENTRRNLQELFERICDFIFVVGLDGRIVEANPAVTTRLGYSAQELRGKPLLMLHPPEHQETAAKFVHEILTGKGTTCDLPLQTAAGEVIPVDTKVSFGTWNGEQVLYGLSRDISDRIEAEQALRESEERYRLLADNAVDMISRHAPDGTVLYVTPSCEALSGYTAEELLGKPAEFLILPDDAEKAWKAVNGVRETGGRYVVEHRLPRKDGTIIWVENSGRFVRDASGNLTEIQCAVRDITERKRAEKALREKEQHLRTVLQSVPVIMFASDLNGVCTFFGGRGLEGIGGDPGRFVGTSMLEYYADRPKMKAWLERALAGEDFSVEYLHEPSGRTLVGHAAQLYDAEGEREGVVVVSFDVTEQKRAQDSLESTHAIFQDFAKRFPGFIFIKDEDGRILFVEGAGREFFDADQWLGKRADEFLPKEIADQMHAHDRAALEKGPIAIEESFPETHGTLHYWHTWRFPIRGEGGRRLLAGVGHDITEQKKAENALERAHAMFQDFAKRFPGFIFIKDEDGRILFVEGAGREFFDADQWLGKRADEFLPKEIADQMHAHDRAALEKGPIAVEESFADKYGNMHYWRTWKFPIRGEDGRPLLAGIGHDITEQRKAENAYQALVELSLQGLALVRSGGIIFVNPQASVITGYSKEELLSLSPDGVFALVFPADHAMVLDRIQRRQCGEELPPLFHMRICRKDGAIRRLLMSTIAIEYDNAPVVQVAFVDVTDFREARYQDS